MECSDNANDGHMYNTPQYQAPIANEKKGLVPGEYGIGGLEYQHGACIRGWIIALRYPYRYL